MSSPGDTDPSAAIPADQAQRAMRVASLALLGAIVVLALNFGENIFVPLALAVLLSFVLDPLVAFLRRSRFPRALAVVIAVLVTATPIVGTSVVMGSQVVQLSKDLPIYQATISRKLRTLRQQITGPGVLDGPSRLIDLVEGELEATRRALENRRKQGQGAPLRVQVEPSAGSWLQALDDWLRPFLVPVLKAGLVVIFLIFILLERNDLRDRVLRLMGGDLHRITDAVNEAAVRVSRYLTMQLTVNVCFALALTAGLGLIGVPGALLWGVLGGVLRFVPFIGALISAVFPLTMAFAVDPGWSMLLWTLGLIVTLDTVTSQLIEPWLYGGSTGLAPVAVLISAAFWTTLWGPTGLILSTPLTVCLVVMGRHLPQLRFIEVLLGDSPPFSPAMRLYQRLLAGNTEEAVELAVEQAHAQSLAAFYGDTAVPALRHAAGDHVRASTAEHRHRVTTGMAALIRDLREEWPPPPALGDADVVCVGLKWELDALAADMLVHALQHEGLGARALPAVAVSADHIGELDLSGVRVVCVSCFSQSPEISARFVCRRLRRQRPDLRIVLALWAGPQALLVPGAVETLGADAAAASFDEALQRLKGYAGAEDRPVAEAAPAAPAPAPALPSTDDLDSCMSLEDAARHAGEVFDVDAAMVLLADRRCHSWSASPESAGFGPALLSAGLADRALAEPERFSVPDVARDPRWADDAAVPAAGVRFVACTALYDEAGTVLGALCLMDARARTLSPQDERLLAALGEEVAGMLRASAGKDSPQVFASYPLSGGARASSA